ncbi:hypothetical protein H4219_001396 [Mycoemilia scoparia]|uniref:BHLH domain-containing protein n=1 Tax=Mycoemilia scoparia TaxID=417184 RepID=A0A9W8DW33_9FUNG|nr:hypothetical protein H4219_001396 [Mycoemilia scoparia]
MPEDSNNSISTTTCGFVDENFAIQSSPSGSNTTFSSSTRSTAVTTPSTGPIQNFPYNDAAAAAESKISNENGTSSAANNSSPKSPTVSMATTPATTSKPAQKKIRTSSFRVNGVNILNRNNIDAKTANERLQRRRENHNFVERRRRDNINQTIQQLADLIPNASKDHNKTNKGSVLRMAVEHIKEMQCANQSLIIENNRLRALVSNSSASTSPVSILPPPISNPKNAGGADPAKYNIISVPMKTPSFQPLPPPKMPLSATHSRNPSHHDISPGSAPSAAPSGATCPASLASAPVSPSSTFQRSSYSCTQLPQLSDYHFSKAMPAPLHNSAPNNNKSASHGSPINPGVLPPVNEIQYQPRHRKSFDNGRHQYQHPNGFTKDMSFPQNGSAPSSHYPPHQHHQQSYESGTSAGSLVNHPPQQQSTNVYVGQQQPPAAAPPISQQSQYYYNRQQQQLGCGRVPNTPRYAGRPTRSVPTSPHFSAASHPYYSPYEIPTKHHQALPPPSRLQQLQQQPQQQQQQQQQQQLQPQHY